ncbi:tetratricopeptide repeat protein [Glycomyces rhizosphaerae]|uniref:Tetratricopeptide repeat protein n=1 Tax=Glycomyces rhizosphaerae TaxID=2054422 RepID=A0ABV7PW43_9ACTN
MSVSIDDLRLFRFVVRIEADPGDGSAFVGSGFLAAPGLVLTCAHVVNWFEDGESFRVVSAVPEVNAARAVVSERSAREAGPDELWAWPDLAVVELLDADGRRETRHPLPRLDLGAPVPTGPVRRRAFIAARPNPDSAASVPVLRGVDFRWESVDGQGFWWLADGHALPGMSGGMLVDPERGAICAVINNSRGLGAAVGSVATPLSALGNGFGEAVRAQAATGFSAVPEWDTAFTRRSDVPWRDTWNPGVTARHFVGRTTELQKLQDNLEKAGGLAVVQSIGGFGGVGKTALAVAFAERCRDRFDGRVFHDFESYRGTRADTAADALGSILTGIGAATPKEVELLDHRARAERWRAAAVGRRLLMVWDNVDSLDQLDGLLIRSEGCATIVTTRDVIRIDDADRTLRLDVLQEADAIAMFLEIAGDRHPLEQVTELVRRDLYVPVLIATHAREVANEEVALEEIIEDLPEPAAVRGQTDPYLQRDVFDRLEGSYRRLEPEERVAFRAFGAHPGAIATLGSLAAAMECPVREASRRMRGLIRAGLAERDLNETNGGDRDLRRYRAHDLLRVYGAHLAEVEDDLTGSRAALAQYYLDRLGRDFGNRPDWFAAEVETIRALAVTDTTEKFGHLGRFLGYRGLRYSRYDAAETGFSLAEKIDRVLGDGRRTGHSLWGQGEVARLRGQFDEAEAKYRAALQLSETAGDPGGVGNARRGLAEVAQMRGDAERAEAHYLAAMDAYSEGGFTHRMIYVERGLGRVAKLRGDVTLAVARFNTALEASRSEGDDYGIAFAILGLGDAVCAAGEFEAAEERYRESMDLFDRIGDPVGSACAMHGLGNVALGRGDRVLARERLEAAAEAYRKHHAARNLEELAADFARLEASEAH